MGRASEGGRARIVAVTIFTLVAFALNSLLCRMALGEARIDASSFTVLRLASGAVTLFVIAGRRRHGPGAPRAGSWTSGFVLFLYAIAFSFAYLELSTGTGALILFGCVQTTMVLAGLCAGERPRGHEWAGAGIALAGLVALVAPGLTAPSPLGSVSMAAAGIGWGIYSLRGRGSTDPVGDTAGNFLRALPFVFVVGIAALSRLHLSAVGALLAVTSGAVTSGLGYVAWYTALRRLSATRAATVQLAVPVLAAGMGVAFLAESITPRLVVCTLVVLGGVRLAIGRTSPPAPVPAAEEEQ